MPRSPKPQKATSSQTSSPATASLALSSLHLRYQELEKQHQWLLKQIQRKRSELKNLLEQMRSLASKIFHQGEPLYRQLLEIDREIHALFEEILNNSKFGKLKRQKIQQIYQRLQWMGVISPQQNGEDQELDEMFGAEAEEGANPFTAADFFEQGGQSQQRPPQAEGDREDTPRSADEARQIRRTFLRLAEIFHPDKVTDQQTQMRHTEIMKEVNRAYNDGDLARLLELERQHQVGGLFATDSASASDLERQCERLETDNQLLKKQYENLKRELRLLRNTPEGEMVKDYRTAVREKVEPIEAMLAEMKEQIQGLAEILHFVRDFRDRKITLKEFVQGPASVRPDSPEDLEDILEQMLAELLYVSRI